METYMTVTFLASIIFLSMVAIALIYAIVNVVKEKQNEDLQEERQENEDLLAELKELRAENAMLKEENENFIFPNEYAVERKNKTTPICYGERKEEENEGNDGGVKNSGGMESDLQNRNRENDSIPGRGIYPSDGDRTDE